MAIEASKVKARLRALFPKANLSTKRLNEISDKLSKRIEDDATDAQVDEALNEQNDIYSFEDMAKNDDRERTERTKASKEKQKTKENEVDSDDGNDDSDAPAWAKSLIKQNQELTQRLEGIEKAKQAETLAERFRKDDRLKGVPDFMINMAIPKDEDSFDDAVSSLAENFKTFAEKAKLQDYGNDMPSNGTTQFKKGNVKPLSKEEADAIVKSMS